MIFYTLKNTAAMCFDTSLQRLPSDWIESTCQPNIFNHAGGKLARDLPLVSISHITTAKDQLKKIMITR
jgi:hypothetical protein